MEATNASFAGSGSVFMLFIYSSELGVSLIMRFSDSFCGLHGPVFFEEKRVNGRRSLFAPLEACYSRSVKYCTWSRPLLPPLLLSPKAVRVSSRRSTSLGSLLARSRIPSLLRSSVPPRSEETFNFPTIIP